MDSDNFIAGAKPLRDAIAKSLGVDDGDPRLRWSYGEALSPGPAGVLVIVSAQ